MSTDSIRSDGSSLYQNSRVAIQRDSYLRLHVWSGDHWVPLTDLDDSELQTLVEILRDSDPLFEWWTEVNNVGSFGGTLHVD